MKFLVTFHPATLAVLGLRVPGAASSLLRRRLTLLANKVIEIRGDKIDDTYCLMPYRPRLNPLGNIARLAMI